MNTAACRLICAIAVGIAGIGSGLSQSVYVVPPSTPGHVPGAPYNTWTNAATNLIAAWNEAQAQGWANVVVSSGVHRLTGTLQLTNLVSMRSWNNGVLDPTNTSIDLLGGNRNITVDYPGTVVDGFTVSNSTQQKLSDGVFSVLQGTVRNCTVERNTGRGLRVNGSQAVVERCLVRSCGPQASAGIGARIATGGVLRRCTVSACTASGGNSGGGVYIQDGAVLDCEIGSNYAEYRGGGLYTATSDEMQLVSNCLFRANTAGDNGGGIYIANNGTRTTLDRCRIVGNQVLTNAGGGIVALYGGQLIRNCLIYNNVAKDGGGMRINQSNSCIVNCTIVSNYAASSGGGLYLGGGTNVFVNTIVYSNQSHDIYLGSYTDQVWQYCCVTSAAIVAQGVGCLSDYPRFLAPGRGENDSNYRLPKTSPCVDAGTADFAWVGGLDLDGISRRGPLIGKVDIGGYEILARGSLVRFQ